MSAAGRPLLEVKDLRMHFPITEGIVTRRLIGEVKARNRAASGSQGAFAFEPRRLFGRAWQLGKLLPAIKDRVGHGKWMIWLPDGNSGRRSRLRIAKSSISERPFAFQKTVVLTAVLPR